MHRQLGHNELVTWANSIVEYLKSGDASELPRGVTFFQMRHHSEECPLGEPPFGWDNDKL